MTRTLFLAMVSMLAVSVSSEAADQNSFANTMRSVGTSLSTNQNIRGYQQQVPARQVMSRNIPSVQQYRLPNAGQILPQHNYRYAPGNTATQAYDHVLNQVMPSGGNDAVTRPLKDAGREYVRQRFNN